MGGDGMVGLLGNDDADVHAAGSRFLQGFEERLGRAEIGGLEISIRRGRVQLPDVPVQEDRIVRTAAHDLDVVRFGFQVDGQRFPAAAETMPVREEDAVELGCGRTFDPQVRILPVVVIVVLEIHPAKVTDAAVDHDDFPVVVMVYFRHDFPQMPVESREISYFDARIRHFAEKVFPHEAVVHALDDEPDRDAFPGLGLEGGADHPAGRVIAQLVIVQVDALPGSGDIFQQQIPMPLSGSYDLQAGR